MLKVDILSLCINGINDFKYGNSNVLIHESKTYDTSLTRGSNLCLHSLS